MFLVEPGTKPAVEAELARLGGDVIPFAVARAGLEVRSDGMPPLVDTR